MPDKNSAVKYDGISNAIAIRICEKTKYRYLPAVQL